MGMFDYIVTPDVKCPGCKEPLSGFQSKDGPCGLDTLSHTEVDNFYTHCKCGFWIQFDRLMQTESDIPGFAMCFRKAGSQNWENPEDVI